MKVLIIEDDVELTDTIQKYLQKENMLVESSGTFNSGLEKVSFFNYDCILLDINLPGGTGFDILKYIKELKLKSNVIILSAKDSLDDKLLGLDLGADDYIAKPFHLAELNARIKAVIRRNNHAGQEVINIGNVILDINNRKVVIEDKEIEFYRKEFDILYYFINNLNRLLTKSSIAEYTWGDQYEDSDDMDFVYYQIKNIRKKLKEANANILIKSTYGIGYTMKLA
ncbi:MAG TPA: response regulator transcription factor [Saprospiraceae bacterium]|jgi:DNA-binding response OmpR family regulator|nr:response regulator transcription factor [Saprospiraceae bacterium]